MYNNHVAYKWLDLHCIGKKKIFLIEIQNEYCVPQLKRRTDFYKKRVLHLPVQIFGMIFLPANEVNCKKLTTKVYRVG